jgi:hypothetical protein
MSVSVILSFLKISFSLQIALVAETHMADRLALKLWLTTEVEKSLIIRKRNGIKYGRTNFIFKYINKK